MIYLKANTSQLIMVGPFVDRLNFYTPEVAVTLAACDDAILYKYNTDISYSIQSRTWNHKGGGLYALALTAEDLDTPGLVRLYFRDDSVFLPFAVDITVLAEVAYDAFITGDFLGESPESDKHSLQKIASMISLVRNEQIKGG